MGFELGTNWPDCTCTRMRIMPRQQQRRDEIIHHLEHYVAWKGWHSRLDWIQPKKWHALIGRWFLGYKRTTPSIFLLSLLFYFTKHPRVQNYLTTHWHIFATPPPSTYHIAHTAQHHSPSPLHPPPHLTSCWSPPSPSTTQPFTTHITITHPTIHNTYCAALQSYQPLLSYHLHPHHTMSSSNKVVPKVNLWWKGVVQSQGKLICFFFFFFFVVTFVYHKVYWHCFLYKTEKREARELQQKQQASAVDNFSKEHPMVPSIQKEPAPPTGLYVILILYFPCVNPNICMCDFSYCIQTSQFEKGFDNNGSNPWSWQH